MASPDIHCCWVCTEDAPPVHGNPVLGMLTNAGVHCLINDGPWEFTPIIHIDCISLLPSALATFKTYQPCCRDYGEVGR